MKEPCVSGIIYVAVKNHDGHAAFIYFLDYGRECRGFVWRNDYYIEAIVDKILYIPDLFFIAVIGRADFDNGIFMKHDFTVDFVIHFVAPVILTALRYTDSIYFALGASQ